MKRAAVPTQPVITFFFALFFAVGLTLAGCSASTISGPDLAPTEEVTDVQAPADDASAPHNEGYDVDQSQKTGTSTVKHASRN